MITQTSFLGTNALVYTPPDYTPAKSYPCMIFHPGSGEMGPGNTSISLLSVHGPFLYINSNTFNLGVEMIVIAIQPADANPRPIVMQAYIAAIKAMYNVSAIIGTGLSRGGQSWDWFIGNAQSQLAEMAGLVIFSSEGPVTDEPGIAGSWTPSWFASNNVPYWAGCGDQDSFYDANSLSVLPRYQSLVAVAPQLATLTVWKGAGHGDPVWSDGYNPAWTNNVYGMSIYQWAAQVAAGNIPSNGSSSTITTSTTKIPATTSTTTTSSTTKPLTTSTTTTTSTTNKPIRSITVNFMDGSSQTLS